LILDRIESRISILMSSMRFSMLILDRIERPNSRGL